MTNDKALEAALPGEAEVVGLVGKLRYLVSLDEPKNGGPFGGFAAQECMRAMSSAADALQAMQARAKAAEARVKDLEEALERIDEMLPNPKLPLTHAIKDITTTALKGGSNG